MYSSLFCGTLEISTQGPQNKKDDEFGLKLYKIELLKYQELIYTLIRFLSIDERNRANKYHFEKDRNRFIICRALLKFLLAEHVVLKIDAISLERDDNKKPYLSSHPSVFFNVTHSADFAIIAIAKNPVGVDVEYINKDFDYNEILPSTFNKLEIDVISKSTDKYQSFYKFWTRKEAIVKAIGKGIDDDLIKISVTDGMHSVSSSIFGNFKKLSVFSFNIREDYVGSLAMTQDLYDLGEINFYGLPTSNELLSVII